MTDLVQTIVGTFLFKDTNIRIFGTCDAPLFVANDVFATLNLDVRMVRTVPTKWIRKYKMPTKGGMQLTNLLTESGLYWIVMRSNKTEAVPFQEWVCEEVLPSIRATGQYKLDEERQKLLNDLKEETYHRIQFQKMYTKAMEQNEEQYETIKYQTKMNTELHHDLLRAKNPNSWTESPVKSTKEERAETKRMLKAIHKIEK